MNEPASAYSGYAPVQVGELYYETTGEVHMLNEEEVIR